MRLPPSITLTRSPGRVGVTVRSVVLKLVPPVPATLCADAGVAPATRSAAVIATVTTMRRTRLILALLTIAAAFIGAARPAEAHICSFPVEVAIGEPVTLNVGVPAEAKPVTQVDIEIPDGFELGELFDSTGFVAERRG